MAVSVDWGGWEDCDADVCDAGVDAVLLVCAPAAAAHSSTAAMKPVQRSDFIIGCTSGVTAAVAQAHVSTTAETKATAKRSLLQTFWTDDPSDRNAHDVQTQHWCCKDRLRDRIPGRRNNCRDDKDEQYCVFELCDEESGGDDPHLG